DVVIGARNVPSPLPCMTLTVLGGPAWSKFVTATSNFPSLLKSPVTTELGSLPTSIPVGPRNDGTMRSSRDTRCRRNIDLRAEIRARSRPRSLADFRASQDKAKDISTLGPLRKEGPPRSHRTPTDHPHCRWAALGRSPLPRWSLPLM